MLTLSADQLRWLGEEADGRRQEDLALVVVEDRLMLLPTSDRRATNVIAKVQTPLEGEGGMAGGGRIGISYNGRALEVQGADAAFFSQSAVEKFVLPYYTRVASPAQIQALKNKLFAKGVVIAIHDPPSITSAVYPGESDEMQTFKAVEFDEPTGTLTIRASPVPAAS